MPNQIWWLKARAYRLRHASQTLLPLLLDSPFHSTPPLQPKLASMSATHLTQALVSISQLRFVPPQSWLMAFLCASRAQLRHYTPAHVTATYQVRALGGP